MDSQTFLNENLANTFNGVNVIGEIMIAGRLHKIVEAKDEEGNTYTDIWIAGGRVTAGREIAMINGKTYTRSYEGGHMDLKNNTEITGEMVLEFLGEMLQLKESRWNKSLRFEKGDWTYNYQVIGTHSVVPITTGVEEISYKGKVVFVHNLSICPLES